MKKSAGVPADPSSFREWLGEIDDTLLGTILSNRPDVAAPPPPGLASLAARLQIRSSITPALAQLTAVELLTLEAAAVLGGELTPVDAPDVIHRILQGTAGSPLGEPTDSDIRTAITHLREFALIFGSVQRFKIVPEVMTSLPMDWQLLPDPNVPSLTHAETQEWIEQAGTRCQKILNTLLDSGGSGLTKDADLNADPTRPIPMMLAAGVLVRVDSCTVRLAPVTRRVLWDMEPLDVPFVPPRIDAPASSGAALTEELLVRADHDASASGLETVRLMRDLIELLSKSPVSCLRDSSIGVRNVQRLAKDLQVDTLTIGRLVGVGLEAGLLARGVPQPPLPDTDAFKDYLSPTAAADEWLHSELDFRWLRLIEGWLMSPWAAWLAQRPVNLLGSSTLRNQLVNAKELLIAQCVRAPRLSLDEILGMAGYYAPLRALRMQFPAEILEEAVWLGILASDHSPTHMAMAIAQNPLGLHAAVQKATPRPVEYLIAQGDMTILAPGPLSPSVQHMVELIAEIESPGLASVYRITEASVKQALDAGFSTQDVEEFLQKYIAGEVPQAISYLLADLARQQGLLRAGTASCYVRCEDEEFLARAVDATPGLRLLAPTVAVSQMSLNAMLESLRRAGFQPAAEDSHGMTLDLRPKPPRISTPQPNIYSPEKKAHDIAELIKQIRKAERERTPATVDQQRPPDIVATLQAALRGGRTVTLGFVDKHGIASVRQVQPITVSQGQLDAIEVSTGAIHRYQLHRITEVIVDN